MAGGFAGTIENNVTVSDCYALGDVTVDRSGSASSAELIYAGGFVGHINANDSYPLVTRCFSKGVVMAQAYKTSSGQTLYVGGMAGYLTGAGSRISNCASLAPYYSIKGGYSSTRGIGRISGNASSNLSNNYACAAQLYDSSYGSINPSGSAPGNTGTGNKDGITVSSSTFSYQSFWTNGTAGSGPGFNPPIPPSEASFRWNFTGIGSRGHPILAGMGGLE
jgi:hypothetical protein